MLAPASLVGGLGLATLALHLRDPHDSYSWGFCPSAALGLSCPGCGGLRAVNDLTNLRLADAASSNLALVIAIPILIAAIVVWARGPMAGHDHPRAGPSARPSGGPGSRARRRVHRAAQHRGRGLARSLT